jgi:ubiquinone/menaquinone biosynthesis C-methylase UbiE
MKLDIGCGQNKKEGFIGLDCLRMPGVDIVCDINKDKIPLEDSSIDEIYSMHFLEHVDNVLSTMEEIWRISKSGAKITIAVPYFTSVGAFRDPTHQHFFVYDTFDHFTNSKNVPSFYSAAKFKIIKKRMLFYPANSNFYGKIRFVHMMPFQLLAIIFPYFYEHSLFKLFSARDMYVELQVIK